MDIVVHLDGELPGSGQIGGNIADLVGRTLEIQVQGPGIQVQVTLRRCRHDVLPGERQSGRVDTPPSSRRGRL